VSAAGAGTAGSKGRLRQHAKQQIDIKTLFGQQAGCASECNLRWPTQHTAIVFKALTCDLVAPARHIEVAHLDAASGEGIVLHLGQPAGQQLHQGGLANVGGAHQRHLHMPKREH
jgi:hypothetical protein